MLNPLAPTPTTADFRRALGSFSTGIAVATCSLGTGESFGITINSLTSVSLEPLLILFCLGRTTRVYPKFMAADHFAINILAADQEHLARHFAGTMAGDWSTIACLPAATAPAPILQNTLSWMVCQRRDTLPGGDHTIILGEATALGPTRETEPLLYYRGQYRRF